jgi:hypothetical protein
MGDRSHVAPKIMPARTLQDSANRYKHTLQQRARHHKNAKGIGNFFKKIRHLGKENLKENYAKEVGELAFVNIREADSIKNLNLSEEAREGLIGEQAEEGFEGALLGAAVVTDGLKVYDGARAIHKGRKLVGTYQDKVKEFQNLSNNLVRDVDQYNQLMGNAINNCGVMAGAENGIDQRLQVLHQKIDGITKDINKLNTKINEKKNAYENERVPFKREPIHKEIQRLHEELTKQGNTLRETKKQHSELSALKQKIEPVAKRLSDPDLQVRIARLADEAKQLHTSALLGQRQGKLSQILGTTTDAGALAAHSTKLANVVIPALKAVGHAVFAKVASAVMVPIAIKGGVKNAYMAHRYRTFAKKAKRLQARYRLDNKPELAAIAKLVRRKQRFVGQVTSAVKNFLKVGGSGVLAGAGIAGLFTAVPAVVNPVGLALVGVSVGIGLGYAAYKIYKHVKTTRRVQRWQQALQMDPNNYQPGQNKKLDQLIKRHGLDPNTITPPRLEKLKNDAQIKLLSNDGDFAARRLFDRIRAEGVQGDNALAADFLRQFGFDNPALNALKNTRADKHNDAIKLITERLHLAAA